MNRNITAYKIVESGFPSTLAELIAREIGYGWQPFGCLTIATSSMGGNNYYQALVKYSQ